jgi:hypothetical protein
VVKQKFAAVFRDQADSLPFAKQSADGKGRNVGSICQLFIRDLEANATGSSPTDALGKAEEHVSKAFASGMADET